MALWSVVGGVSTAVMAIYTGLLYRVNDGLSKLNRTLIAEGQRQQAERQATIRMTVSYRLQLARTTLEEGIVEPVFLIMWAQRTLDWRHPPADDLVGAFRLEQKDAVIRAFLAMESFTNGVLMLTWTHKQSSGPLGWVVPVSRNHVIKQEAQKIAQGVLPVVREAQTLCGFAQEDVSSLP